MSPITGAAEELMFNTRADHQAVWVHRLADETTSPQPLVDALKKIKPPPGAGFVWIAAEAILVRVARLEQSAEETKSNRR
ncbi:MAG: SIP domain-containing protein [Bryobacteraceae bacterium]